MYPDRSSVFCNGPGPFFGKLNTHHQRLGIDNNRIDSSVESMKEIKADTDIVAMSGLSTATINCFPVDFDVMMEAGLQAC